MALSHSTARSSLLPPLTSSSSNLHQSQPATIARASAGAPHHTPSLRRAIIERREEALIGLRSDFLKRPAPLSYTTSSSYINKRAHRHAAARASSGADVSTSGRTGKATAQGLGEQKAAILRAVANTNRGKNTTPRQRQQILGLIEALEVQNPTLDPVDSPLISGTWSLLYTASTKEQFTYAGTEEGPFLARVKPAAFGQVRSKGSTQIIRSETGHVDNIAEFSVFGRPGSLCITGSFAPAAPLPDRGAVRIDVRFVSFTLKLGWVNLRVPLGWVNPTGWIDTTYLDDEMRIGRGDKGSVFVTVRRK